MLRPAARALLQRMPSPAVATAVAVASIDAGCHCRSVPAAVVACIAPRRALNDPSGTYSQPRAYALGKAIGQFVHATTARPLLAASRRHQPRQRQPGGHSCAAMAGGPATAAAPTAVADIEAAMGARLTDTPLFPANTPLVIVVSGPSGVGKDAVIRRLQELRPELHFVVTATTRPRRPGEVHGVDYLFLGRPEFESLLSAGGLLEHAVVYGEHKGIPRAQVDDALARGTDVVLRVDVQGAAALRRLLPTAVSIFLAAESERALVTRLASRMTEPLDALAVRAATARMELARWTEFDYAVINRGGEMEATVHQLCAIIDAEKARTARHQPAS